MFIFRLAGGKRYCPTIYSRRGNKSSKVRWVILGKWHLVQYSNGRLKRDRLYFGFSYVTSRLGTAMHSNAVKQDNFLFNSAWFFRPKHTFRPFVRMNVGYFAADYGPEIFDVLPNTSMLLSPEAGAIFEMKSPLKITASLGYNLITGNGESGPGTLYPLFIQTTISWSLFKK